MPKSFIPLEPDRLAVVQTDGLPRTARYRDEAGAESVHVAFLRNDILHTMPAADWPPPLPTEPTQAESTAAILARQQAAQQAQADAAALRQRVLSLANSTVGVQIDALSAGQVRALVALLLWRAGALDRDGAVRPLTEWLNGAAANRT